MKDKSVNNVREVYLFIVRKFGVGKYAEVLF